MQLCDKLVSNPLVTPIHNGTTCVRRVNFMQNGDKCVLKNIIDEAYKHHNIPVLSNSVENSL